MPCFPEHNDNVLYQATAKAEPEGLQQKRAADFMKAYEPFDWTAQL